MQWFHSLSRRLRAMGRGVGSYFEQVGNRERIERWRLLYRMRLHIAVHVKRFRRRRPLRIFADKRGFLRLEKLISRAKRSIVIQMFIWKDDEAGRFIAASLLQAAVRGVSIVILKEATGDVFEFGNDFLATRHENNGLWKAFWQHPNIEVRYVAHRNHAKVFIFDGEILALTGMNIANEYMVDWHDYVMELRGSQFVGQLLAEKPAKTTAVRVVVNTADRKDIRPTLMHLLSQVKKSIVVEHLYLSDKAVLDELIRLSHRVRTTIILPKNPGTHHYANRETMQRLLKEGGKHLRLFLYPRMSHAKVILIDQTIVFAGSANLMTSSLDDMGEANVLVTVKVHRFTAKLRWFLRRDMLRSTLITKAPAVGWLGWMLARLRL